VVLAEELQTLAPQTKPLDNIVDFFGFLEAARLGLLVNDHIDVDVRVDKGRVRGLLDVALQPYQAVLLDALQNGLLVGNWLPTAVLLFIGLDPNDVLATLVTPLLEQLTTVVKVFATHPQEDEGRVVGNQLDVELKHLLEGPRFVAVWLEQVGRQALRTLFVLLPGWVDQNDVELAELREIKLLKVLLDVDRRVIFLTD